MTDDEKRIKIAEAYGWTNVNSKHHKKQPFVYGSTPQRVVKIVPDYLNDLNAIHEAVNSQSSEFRIRYAIQLEDIAGSMHYWNATAYQRAEAFLKTIEE